MFVQAMFLLLACGSPLSAAETRPNVIVFLIDDLGWKDLSCQGSSFYETPKIDALARSGARFLQAYSACTVCSPTRAALMTGRYPARLRVTDWIPGQGLANTPLQPPRWTKHLVHDEYTVAEAFRDAGYATALFGKWHLGGEGFEPKSQGFEHNVGGTNVGQPPSYFFPYGKLPGLEAGEPGEYLTDRLTSECESFLDRNAERPFFVYFPHYTVHTPLQAKKEKIEKYRAKAKGRTEQNNPTYAAMVESLDESVGRIVAKLAAMNLTERTIIVFTSDNGGLRLSDITHNGPLRAGKGSVYEGGVRVPLIVSRPGTIPAGREPQAPAMTIDLFPTLLQLAGVVPKDSPKFDGVSLAPLLTGSGELAFRDLFWHYPHYHAGGATPYSAIRSGDSRLIQFQETGMCELYDLAADPEERNDLAAKHPERKAELLEKLEAWRRSVGAQPADVNPNYEPAQPTKAKKKKKGK